LNGKLRGSDVGTVAAVVAEDACEVAEENEVLADATVLVAAVVAVDDAGEAEEEDEDAVLDVRVLVAEVVVAVVVEDVIEVVEENDETLLDVSVLVAVVEVEDVCEAVEEDDETLLEVRVLVEAVVELEIVVMGRLLRSWARISGFGTGVGTVVPKE